MSTCGLPSLPPGRSGAFRQSGKKGNSTPRAGSPAFGCCGKGDASRVCGGGASGARATCAAMAPLTAEGAQRVRPQTEPEGASTPRGTRREAGGGLSRSPLRWLEAAQPPRIEEWEHRGLDLLRSRRWATEPRPCPRMSSTWSSKRAVRPAPRGSSWRWRHRFAAQPSCVEE
jgi:hypothetical protein